MLMLYIVTYTYYVNLLKLSNKIRLNYQKN